MVFHYQREPVAQLRAEHSENRAGFVVKNPWTNLISFSGKDGG
jgi:hypothetical protein